MSETMNEPEQTADSETSSDDSLEVDPDYGHSPETWKEATRRPPPSPRRCRG